MKDNQNWSALKTVEYEVPSTEPASCLLDEARRQIRLSGADQVIYNHESGTWTYVFSNEARIIAQALQSLPPGRVAPYGEKS